MAEVEDLDARRHGRVGRLGQGWNTATAAVQLVDHLVDGAAEAEDAAIQHLQLRGCGADGLLGSDRSRQAGGQQSELQEPEVEGRHVGEVVLKETGLEQQKR